LVALTSSSSKLWARAKRRTVEWSSCSWRLIEVRDFPSDSSCCTAVYARWCGPPAASGARGRPGAIRRGERHFLCERLGHPRGHGGGLRDGWGRGERSTEMGADRLSHRFGEGAEQVPGIRYLLGLRSPAAGAFVVGTGPVPADHFDAFPGPPGSWRRSRPCAARSRRPRGRARWPAPTPAARGVRHEDRGSGRSHAGLSVCAIDAIASGPTRQQPPISRAPDSRQPRTSSGAKVERPAQARVSASQASSLLG
jgi:hypothetical protein